MNNTITVRLVNAERGDNLISFVHGLMKSKRRRKNGAEKIDMSNAVQHLEHDIAVFARFLFKCKKTTLGRLGKGRDGPTS